MIEDKCNKLQKNGLAIIHKVPTDWKVLRKFNPKLKRTEIYSAFPIGESKFVDFIGIMNGNAIAIEAKETTNKTSFPFSNIKPYQIKFLNEWENQKGKGYYILRFVEYKEIYLIPCKVMHDWMDNLGRKSVRYDTVKDTKEVVLLDYKNINFEDYI